MSYAKVGQDSDVDLDLHPEGYILCNYCSLANHIEIGGHIERGYTKLHSFNQALTHLRQHAKVGDKVPDYTFKHLEFDSRRGYDVIGSRV